MGLDPVTIIGGAIVKGIADSEGAKTKAKGAKKAANSRIGGYERAKEDVKEWTSKASERYDPYSSAGNEALDLYMDAIRPGGEYNFEESPMYKYQLSEFKKNIGAQLASTGKSRSGTSIEGYYQPGMLQLGAMESQAHLDRLTPIINTGYNATNQQASIDMTAGQAISGYSSAIGNAKGQGQEQAANAWGNFSSQLGNTIQGGIGDMMALPGAQAQQSIMNNYMNPAQPTYQPMPVGGPRIAAPGSMYGNYQEDMNNMRGVYN